MSRASNQLWVANDSIASPHQRSQVIPNICVESPTTTGSTVSATRICRKDPSQVIVPDSRRGSSSRREVPIGRSSDRQATRHRPDSQEQSSTHTTPGPTSSRPRERRSEASYGVPHGQYSELSRPVVPSEFAPLGPLHPSQTSPIARWVPVAAAPPYKQSPTPLSPMGIPLLGLMSRNGSTPTLVEPLPPITMPTPCQSPAMCPSAQLLGATPHELGSPRHTYCVLPASCPFHMPIPQPATPPNSITRRPSIESRGSLRIVSPKILSSQAPVLPQISSRDSVASTSDRSAARNPRTDRRIQRRPSIDSDSDWTIISPRSDPVSFENTETASFDGTNSKKKRASDWETRGQFLYEISPDRPKLKDSFPSGALLYSPTHPRIQWNVLLPTSTAVDMTVGDGLSPMKVEHIKSPATIPPIKVIHLIIPDRIAGAWTIRVTNRKPGHIVTVEDVLHAISTNLKKPVYDHEPQWVSLSKKQQTGIARTLHQNRALVGKQIPEHALRVDFLEGKIRFVGLSRDYVKCGLPKWRRFIPGVKPYGEEMWNFWVVELEEIAMNRTPYLGDR